MWRYVEHSNSHNNKKEAQCLSLFSQSRGPFPVGIYLGTAGCHFLAGRWRRVADPSYGATGDIPISAARFWSMSYLLFYAYYVLCVGLFAMFWFVYSPHRWQYWSILGTSLIIFVTGSRWRWA